MKKVTAIITLITLFGLLLSGCQSKPENVNYEVVNYRSKVADVANDGILDTYCEYDSWSQGYFKKGSENNRSVSVYGNTYSGVYKQSITDKYNSYTTNVYRDENGIEFGLRDDTGKFVFLNLMNAEFFDMEP